jgi:hypothetical protein
MSFVIAVHVREGIVMASDSRLTLNTTNQELDGKQVNSVGDGHVGHELQDLSGA